MRSSRADLARQLQAMAFRQSGYFTAAQARGVGYSYQAQKHHADAGNWVRVDRALFRLPAWPAGADDTLVRWGLWADSIGVVSHATALRAYDLSDADPARVHLTVPPSFRGAEDAVVLHRADLPADDVEARQGWRVTTVLRTLADVAGGDDSQEVVDAAVAEVLERGLVTRRRLRERADAAGDRAALRVERALAALAGPA